MHIALMPSENESIFSRGMDSPGCFVTPLVPGRQTGLPPKEILRMAHEQVSKEGRNSLAGWLTSWIPHNRRKQSLEIRRWLSNPLEPVTETSAGFRSFPACVPAAREASRQLVAEDPSIGSKYELEMLLVQDFVYPPPNMDRDEHEIIEKHLATLPEEQALYYRIYEARRYRAELILQAIQKKKMAAVINPVGGLIAGCFVEFILPNNLFRSDLSGSEEVRQIEMNDFSLWLVEEKLKCLDGAVIWLKKRGFWMADQAEDALRTKRDETAIENSLMAEWQFFDNISQKTFGVVEYMADLNIYIEWIKDRLVSMDGIISETTSRAPDMGKMLNDWVAQRSEMVDKYIALRKERMLILKKMDARFNDSVVAKGAIMPLFYTTDDIELYDLNIERSHLISRLERLDTFISQCYVESLLDLFEFLRKICQAQIETINGLQMCEYLVDEERPKPRTCKDYTIQNNDNGNSCVFFAKPSLNLRLNKPRRD